MPQLQNVVLTDRAATPANHTFIPVNISNGAKGNLGTVEESTGVPIGNPQLQVAMNKTAGGRYQGLLKLRVPVVATQTINGVNTPTVVRTAYADLTVTFDPTSNEDERKNLVGMLQSALDSSKTLINDTLVKLQGVY